jgi:hypothetical protein
MQIELGALITVAIAVIGAWWAIAVIAIKQFEGRQDVKFASIENSISKQNDEIDGHLQRQDHAMNEIRRVENELSRCQVDAAGKYQTKIEANSQHAQIINEIRAIGTRIDGLHGIVRGTQ